jgi:hypothetical protein
MSLYVKVFNTFWTHRKTIHLQSLIGNDAYWLPPRLWSYAASNQPDGCFASYTDRVLAVSLGWQGDATSMRQALLEAGFLDDNPLRIHDWEEHNAYHKSYSDRAKAAAKAKWEKERQRKAQEEQKGEIREGEGEGDKHCLTAASSTRQAGGRLHGIPASVEEVIAYGSTLNPPVSESRCRAFWSHYEGQARTNESGDTFWVTSGDAIVTKWKQKLPAFADDRYGNGGKTFSLSGDDRPGTEFVRRNGKWIHRSKLGQPI